MAAKMLRCASVGPMRVAVIHIGREGPPPDSSFFAGKSNYFNSSQTEVDGGMVIAKNFWKFASGPVLPLYSQTCDFNQIVECSEEKRCD